MDNALDHLTRCDLLGGFGSDPGCESLRRTGEIGTPERGGLIRLCPQIGFCFGLLTSPTADPV